ncbi:MAG: Diaminohydroxyphosphoribosylaminopyrimidine deaminase (EC / 5-amino-6-(5-phosphoribosylamino)uracil reductase (EC [uncultured Thiotrichaceae bacterium]|uniref:Riboflavin biosynthesis protein RibD n=1 Tax=uncultured Thiotrichaceae bacterium TaxID=298394 RepID=A0A6S6U323_9GAMM|nr:MAG: Diaminohydroxyphosphoribosylaminopyrimidine deaminase (EC / 5-amino-6-(5-phosphoribosylamino)uracil reductase (EC [uncultured Thiotrichaceae bacterium]
MRFSEQDARFMARAIQLAKKGLYTTHPNPRVGCVIVKDNDIISEGFTSPVGQAHAEVNALRGLSLEQTTGATAYVTLEPCSHTGRTPPCSQALITSCVARVVVATQDPNPQVSGSGLKQLEEAGIEVSVGLMEEQSKALLNGFIKRMETGLPWVSVKLAMSLDGRTAMASGESKWITGPDARRDVQFLRAKSSAVLTGLGTVLADDPSMNVRLNHVELDVPEVRQPVRVILDPQCDTPPESKLFSLDGDVWIVTSQSDSSKAQVLSAKGAEIIQVDSEHAERLPLLEVCRELAKREINEVHVEAGATLCGAFIQEGLVDELVIYMAAHLMGSEARGLLNMPGLDKMSDRTELQIKDIRAIGDDWRIIALPKLKPSAL